MHDEHTKIFAKLQGKVSRRTLLKGVGLGGAAAALANFGGWAQAQEGSSLATTGGTFRMMVGDIGVTAVNAARLQLPSSSFGIGAPEGGPDEVLTSVNLPTGTIPSVATPVLFEVGGNLVLLDTGTGAPNVTLMSGLASLGVMPEDIDTVIISHWHGDHTGGLSFDGELAFPNANVMISETEYAFIQDGGDTTAQARSKLAPADDAGVLMQYTDGDELFPGITAVAAPGHTPGHFVFDIQSGGQRLWHLVDTANHQVIALRHPEWGFGFDGDVEQATATRRMLLGTAADEQIMIMAYHFPFAGTGYVARNGEDGFSFTPSL
ncbi:MAG: MBL fold metallo-hydrolase [Trueperaceae bacterium]|nr:MBL fold metallo-hydrolase [Trueperaceae bacterium]